jgi:hypothetical protein
MLEACKKPIVVQNLKNEVLEIKELAAGAGIKDAEHGVPDCDTKSKRRFHLGSIFLI